MRVGEAGLVEEEGTAGEASYHCVLHLHVDMDDAAAEVDVVIATISIDRAVRCGSWSCFVAAAAA